MQATENVLLAQRKESNKKSATGLNKILGVVFVSILILLTLFIQKARANFFAKRKAKALTKQNAELEQRVLERTEEVVKSKNILSDTFERISDAFVALDKNWRYTYMNKKAGEIFQRAPEQMIGKHIWTEFPEGINQSFYIAYNQAMETQQYIYLEEYYAPSGLWLENHIYPSPDGLSVFFRDITEQKKAEEKLYKSEELLRLSSELANVAAWEYNVETNSMSRSDNHDKLYGIENQGKWERHTFIDATHPDDRDTCNIIIDNSLAIGGPDQYKFDFRIIYPDKSIHWLNVIGKIIERNPEGFGKKIRGFITDITDRKKAEDAIKASEEKYRTLIEQASDGIFLSDENGKYVEVNTSACQTLGYTKEEIYKLHIQDLAVMDKDSLPFRFDELSVGKSVIQERRLRRKDGSVFPVEISARQLPNGRLLGMVRDLTERIEAQQMLQKEKELSDKIINSLPGLFYLTDQTPRLLRWNKTFETISGYSAQELGNIVPLSLFDPMDHKTAKQSMEETYKEGAGDAEIRLLTKDGQKIPFYFTGTRIEYEGRLAILGTGINISERKKAADAIKASEEKYRTLVEQASDAIFITDTSGRFITVNTSACQLSQYSEEELLNMTIYDFAIIEDIQKEPFHFNELQQGKTVITERIVKRKEGIPIYVEINAKLLSDGRLLTFVRDISERKKIEEQAKLLTQQLLKAEEIAQFGFLDWNLITNDLVLSPQINIIYGISEDVINVAEFISKVAHPEDKSFINENLELAIKGIKAYNIDHRIIRTDGTIRWLNARGELTRDVSGNPVRLLGTILDITESKLAEEKLKTYNDQLKELTTHMINIREEERKRIGREIHDELGQQLTAIKMDVAWIDKKVPDKTALLKNKLKNVIALLDGSNHSIRRILSELRPGILDDHGLLDAIKWLGSQFTGNTGIPVKFTTEETEIKLSEPVATCIFRVYQEAFTNITRYAHAGKVSTSLSVIDETIIVTIEDNGKGFDITSLQTKKSFGILGMKERVVSLNGKFELVSSPGKGTKITISLPFKNLAS